MHCQAHVWMCTAVSTVLSCWLQALEGTTNTVCASRPPPHHNAHVIEACVSVLRHRAWKAQATNPCTNATPPEPMGLNSARALLPMMLPAMSLTMTICHLYRTSWSFMDDGGAALRMAAMHVRSGPLKLQRI
jgi:hypothetical protein